jgi:hypothetical protein
MAFEDAVEDADRQTEREAAERLAHSQRNVELRSEAEKYAALLRAHLPEWTAEYIGILRSRSIEPTQLHYVYVADNFITGRHPRHVKLSFRGWKIHERMIVTDENVPRYFDVTTAQLRYNDLVPRRPRRHESWGLRLASAGKSRPVPLDPPHLTKEDFAAAIRKHLTRKW